LPDLLLAPQKRPYHALKEKEKEKAKERRKLAAVHRGHRKSKSAPSQVKLNAEEGIRAAFYVAYDAASFSSSREYARQIDLLFPDWLHIRLDGHLQASTNRPTNSSTLCSRTRLSARWMAVMPFLKSEDTGMEAPINNFDGIDWWIITVF
jgi:hypothetical protein